MTPAVEDGDELAVVKSPIVGTFYQASEPGAPPFATVGDVVRKGQVLCIIEAMKLMNEIESRVRRRDRQGVCGKRAAGPIRRTPFRDQADVAHVQENPDRQPGRNRPARDSACRDLGIKTVAVYSEADELALHVRFADEAICIGPARSTDSYLNVPAVISAAEITDADAIHPGYGFLSEMRIWRRCVRPAHPLHRARPACDPLDGRQGSGATGDEEGRRARSFLDRTVRSKARSRHRDRPGNRLPRDHQGHRRRRRARHAGGGEPGRIGAALKMAQHEAEASFHFADVYLEKYVDLAPSHRVPGAGRSLRQRGLPGRARVLHPAAAPETARRVSVGRAHREIASQDGRRRDRCRQGGAVHQRRHVRVPDGRKTAGSISWRSTRASRLSIRSPRWSPASTS